MDHRQRILVVAWNPKVAERLLAWLEEGGYETTLATNFASAKVALSQSPELVVSEVKLGEYNGLHLALKAAAVRVPTVLIGPADPVLQNDASVLPAVYLTTLAPAALLDAVETLLGPRRLARTVRPFRARVTTVAAEAEVMWRAFTESPSSELTAFGRLILPN